MARFFGDWTWRPWWKDTSGTVSRIEDPEHGGTIYQFHHPNGLYSHVFAPYKDVWAIAIGKAVAQAIADKQREAVKIVADLEHVRYESQPIPGGDATN